MAYTGTVKSMGKVFGFVACADTHAQFGRDCFLDRSVLSDGVYDVLIVGEEVMFDVQIDAKGQPQAVSIMQMGTQGVVPDATGSGEVPKLRLRPDQIPCKFGALCKFGAACTYSHAGAPIPGMGGKGKGFGKGKGKGFAGVSAYGRPRLTQNDLPPEAQPVTLFNESGYFIPDSALAPAGPPAVMAGRKRPASGFEGPMTSRPRTMGGTASVPCRFGAGCAKLSTGTCHFLHEGIAQGQAAAVPNPGLDPLEPSYVGTMKSVVNTKTGYGFVSSDAVQALYPGKDVFLHAATCPWIQSMNLGLGEMVRFNIYTNDRGQPEVKGIDRM